MTGRQLAARLGVTPATVVPLSDRLEERGLLRREVDPADRRLTWLQLTTAGQEFFRRIWQPGTTKIMHAASLLTPDDRQTLVRLLNKLADHLEHPGHVREDRTT